MDPGRDVWVVQALGQPTGNLNGGLMLFGRYWLHAATERALTDRAGMEARLCSLVPSLYLLWLHLLWLYLLWGSRRVGSSSTMAVLATAMPATVVRLLRLYTYYGRHYRPYSL